MVIYYLLNSFLSNFALLRLFCGRRRQNEKSELNLIQMNYISNINSLQNDIHKMFQTSNDECQTQKNYGILEKETHLPCLIVRVGMSLLIYTDANLIDFTTRLLFPFELVFLLHFGFLIWKTRILD